MPRIIPFFQSVSWTGCGNNLAAHLRIHFIIYNLPDPLILLDSQNWPKQKWKLHTKTAVIKHHEYTLRFKAVGNTPLLIRYYKGYGDSKTTYSQLAYGRIGFISYQRYYVP